MKLGAKLRAQPISLYTQTPLLTPNPSQSDMRLQSALQAEMSEVEIALLPSISVPEQARDA